MCLATELVVEPNPAFILPFVALLFCIAALPLEFPRFWERHHAEVCIALALVPVAYYLFGLHAGGRLFTVARDYLSFMVVTGSLYVVTGGIHLRTRGEATPLRNLLFLFGGALLANFMGTTGASVLLIRPWIRLNRYRYTHFHTVFFIFIISNIGGCLAPIGPPLYLGFLKGVPFWWVASRGWAIWGFTLGLLGLVFFLLDWRNFRAAPRELREEFTAQEKLQFGGLHNLGWLALILGAVFLKHPTGLREALMVLAALGSLSTTHRSVYESNQFRFGPIKEVAWLFAGLFATMVPALDYLDLHGGALGISAPLHFFWASGLLSGVLDNAPTYLAFLTTALGLEHLHIEQPAQVALFLQSRPAHVLAVSLGSVFFGGFTYLGNGPNLMVKAIADDQGVHSPHFFQYVYAFALPVLLPVLALVGWIFFAK